MTHKNIIWWTALIFIISNTNYDKLFVESQYAGSRDRIRGNPIRAQKILRGDQHPVLDADLENGDSYEEIHPLTEYSKQWQSRPRTGYTSGYTPIKLHPCEQSSCYPATGNLLIGREQQLHASSTCGLYGQQRYCIVSHLEDRKKCFWCDSRPTKTPKPLLNHNISNIVYRLYPGTRQKSWWQSENGKENVYIQLDLEAEFHFTHLIITFKTFRPAAMLIERSYDFKQTWQVYRYFAHNCAESFPHVREGYPENLTDVVCESRYSGVAPSTDGEIIYRVLPPTLHIDNPYSEQVQNLLKMTNLRINFTKLHTLGDDLLDKREEIQEKYYYAITDMVVRGSCSCYGHANRCLPLPGIDPKPDMVHGRCECTHNTKGRNCEKCEDFFNDLPWRPAIGKLTNACKRCNCNNHATSCHFDSAVYEATGRVSGGVCDGCQHNTMGPNCELCKPFYYRDPVRDMQDPEICRPCDCDPHGSLDGGICDSVTDTSNSLLAGSCHCKTNVEGRRCDVCKNGYWNFTATNPDGCQPCTCNLHGTIDNQGCNTYNGECTCKRYVTGRDCNQCLPEFWGLSEKRDGCQPCDCDPGGSYDNNCDVIDGKCKCKDHLTGRTCNIPKQHHFTASLDFLLYEAELAKGSQTCQVVIREPYRDGRIDSWTGTGFMKAVENSEIEFTLFDIKRSMEYDPVIRYEPLLPENWDQVILRLIRPQPVDPNGPCAENHPEDDIKMVSIPANSRSVTVFPPACLEAGQTYLIKLEFRKYKYDRDTPSASVLIDSLVLIPRIDAIPWFRGSLPAETRRKEYESNRCAELIHDVATKEIPDICRKYFNSISSHVFDGAFPCQCDPTGSVSRLCDEFGGTCTCKPNVVGRRCDRCAPGTFGFGPEGCQACDCNSIGALDNFCNATTGQCKCRANTYGRECDQCRTGFWNFPNCQRCECNGHADICDSRTGACTECRDNTQGHKCDDCIDGYYGDPRINVDIPCRPCPCPGIPGSGHSYADRCSLDIYTKDVNCECQEGYSGARCDVCSDNYYGNPEVPGGTCKPCNCNNKIDLLKPGNCNPHTGQCLQCLFETTGDHCEICRPGYFRLSEDQLCAECVCNIFGTNSTKGPCDPSSGQCPCLPHVTGLNCDQCEPYHWKIASGVGCESCDCDILGSLEKQCNAFDGQCLCKPHFGGRQCNECLPNNWGDPKETCHACQCNIQGSQTLQCNKDTGACICIPGIGGYLCDECARGYFGYAPNCTRCGECFDNWDRILQENKNHTIDIIEKAGNIKNVGAKGAYTKEFDEMQLQLDEIEQLLNNTADIDLDAIDQALDDLRKRINKTDVGPLKELDDLLGDTRNDIIIAESKLKELKAHTKDLQNKTLELKNNGTQLQEGNVQGALALIQNAKQKADSAAHKAEYTQEAIDYAERQCKATENFINMTEKGFNEQLENNKQILSQLEGNLTYLSESFPLLNSLVCDGQGDPCDSICGGAGCDSCGNSISCEKGAKQLAETALSLANGTEFVLRDKEGKANDFIRNVSQLNTNTTKNLCQQVYDTALLAFTRSNETLNSANNLQKQIREFLNQTSSKPEDYKALAEEVLKKNIQLQPEEIKELAEKIRQAMESLTNIDPIIAETRDDLEEVLKLKADADDAKSKAQTLLEKASEVNDALNKTKDAQDDAEEAITKALNDINMVNVLLNKISNKTNQAQNHTDETSEQIQSLNERLNQLRTNLTKNDFDAQLVKNESHSIQKEAEDTFEKSKQLQIKYIDVKKNLNQKITNGQNSKERADNLFANAFQLLAKITRTKEDITKLENNSQEVTLNNLENDLQKLIDDMHRHTSFIETRAILYKTCT